MDYKQIYKKWCDYQDMDVEIKNMLEQMSDDDDEIKECFSMELEFGTGGLRGIMGAGCNRINIYTIRKATQGLANYILGNTMKEQASVAIAYDSRHKSKLFAHQSACVLAANGIKAYVFDALRPTPMLSYAVRYLDCDAGIVITASHNPPKYNGYKVYGSYGGQITLDDADSILSEISTIDIFNDVKYITEELAAEQGLFEYISEDVDNSYYNEILTTVKDNRITDEARKLSKVVYTPIHGSGLIPVENVMTKLGYDNMLVEESQREPDGNFTTVTSPNPEEKEALSRAISLANDVQADIVLGTDPDADRVGIAVKNTDGKIELLNGNQVGALLTEYILSKKMDEGSSLSNDVVIKTIVTSELGANIAREYGARVIETLTGFKYIGEQMEQMEQNNSGKFAFGYEESYGYLTGTFARDKDAVTSVAIIAEMMTYYKTQGLTLFDVLENIHEKHGYYMEHLVSMTFEGLAGKDKINELMRGFNDTANMKNMFDDLSVLENYNELNRYHFESSAVPQTCEKIELPHTNAIKCIFSDNSWFAVRPSGTEPKIKIYVSAIAKDAQTARIRLSMIKDKVLEYIS